MYFILSLLLSFLHIIFEKVCVNRIVVLFVLCSNAANICSGLTVKFFWAGSPGLVVMGEDSCSKGCEFESRHRILDGHDTFHIYLLQKL